MKAPDDFKVGQVWKDGNRDDLYFVKLIEESGITIQWINSDITGNEEEFLNKNFFRIAFTDSDEYVRELTSLEKELL